MGGQPTAGYHGQQNLSNTGPPPDFHNYQQQQPMCEADRQPSERQPQSVGIQQEEPVDSWEEIADSEPMGSQQEDKESPADSSRRTVEEGHQTSEQPQAVGSIAEDKMDTAKENGAELKAKLTEPRQPKSSKGETREKKDTSRLQPTEVSKVKVVPQLPIHDDKENLNIIFIGHVDAGKSTIGGQLMYVHTYVRHCGLFLEVVLI